MTMTDYDPLSLAIRPSPNETPEETALREQKERNAKAVSDAIDQTIKRERAKERKNSQIKLLLLGQSESGKSTTLRQFQRLYTPTAFREERALWRSVVQLNLARSVRIILDALNYVQNEQEMLLAMEEAISSGLDTDMDPNDESLTGIRSRRKKRRHRRSFGDPFPAEFDDAPVTNLSADVIHSPPDPHYMPTDGTKSTAGSRSHSHHRSHHQSPRRTTPPLLPEEDYIPISPELVMLKFRLEPLRRVESMLISQLAAPNEEEATRLLPSFSFDGDGSSINWRRERLYRGGYGGYDQEVFVRSGFQWKTHLARVQHGRSRSGTNSIHNGRERGREHEQDVMPYDGKNGIITRTNLTQGHSSSDTTPESSTGSIATGAILSISPEYRSNSPPAAPSIHTNNRNHNQGGILASIRESNGLDNFEARNFSHRSHHHHRYGHHEQDDHEVDEPTRIIHAASKDLINLWRDPAVREILRKRKIKLEEGPGFFLDQLERVTQLDYVPSDDDVLRARLKTIGVSEYIFDMEASVGKEKATRWKIYDVGGTRSQRAAWVPYFDNVNAIIFLAPISAFDQTLVEDRSANRLEDSVFLWRSIVSNKVLAGVDLILFLNKCDILSQKLRSGIKLCKYVRSYGDKPNDAENASKYFRSKFAVIQREYSPRPRRFYAYCTSVTDTTTTSGILASVKDIVIREHLQGSRLL